MLSFFRSLYRVELFVKNEDALNALFKEIWKWGAMSVSCNTVLVPRLSEDQIIKVEIVCGKINVEPLIKNAKESNLIYSEPIYASEVKVNADTEDWLMT